MSRIQDILAKAERDGTTRRTSLTESSFSSSTSAVATPVIAPVGGNAALDPSPFRPPIAAVAPNAAVVPAPAAEPRTTRATLHPTLVAAIAPHSAIAEQYRAIRARISAREETGPLRSILVTSPAPGDGKSVTAANLALTMAQEFQRNVVLVDADLRGSSVHALFGIERGPGLAEVLTGEATLDEALVHLPDYRLTILPAGEAPHYPTELLGSTAMRRNLDLLRGRFDRVLLDLPAVAPLADVGTIAPLADGVVMVVRAGVTQRPALEQALRVFEDDRVLGIVLNDAH